MRVTVFVGTVKGGFVLRSNDSRERWEIDGPIFKGWKVTAGTRAPDGTYLVGTGSFVYGAGIHKSRDLRGFTAVSKPPSLEPDSPYKLNDIWTIFADEHHWLAGVDDAALYRSEDKGDTWNEVKSLTEHPTRGAWYPGFGGLCAHSILVDPNNPRRIWCGISAVGVFRSDDGGKSWTPKNEGVPVIIEDEHHKDIGYCVHALVQDPDDPDVIYRQDHKGLFRTASGGDIWENMKNNLPAEFGFPIALDRQTKTLYVVPLESDEFRMPVDGKLTVYRSRDLGDSWEALTDGLPQERAYTGVLRKAMAVDHMDPCGVYVGTTAGNVYVSSNGGNHWQMLPCLLPRILSVSVFTDA